MKITIAGNLKDMFRGLVAVGNHVDPATSAPVLIESMTLAGS
jgi:predicted Zn-dependent protease